MTTQNIKSVLTPAEWQTHSWDEQLVNATRHNESTHGTSPCHLCNRIISDKAYLKASFVHQTIDGNLVDVDMEISEERSQGWFPVGSDCAKKLPKNFLKKFYI